MDPFTHESRVRLVDTDGSGLIHYSALFRHLEMADDEFLRGLGHPYAAFAKAGLKFPRVRVECDYLAPLRRDDQLHIGVTVQRVGSSSFTLGFAVSCAGRPSARAQMVIVCLDEGGTRARPLPETLAAALRALLAPDPLP